MSRRPVSKPNFMHQFEWVSIKLETSFFKIHLFYFCLLSNSCVNFNESITECSIVGKNM